MACGMVLKNSAFNEAITQFILGKCWLEKGHVANAGFLRIYNETLISFPAGRRPSALHSSAQALVAATPQHEDHQDHRQLLQRGLQGGDGHLSNTEWVFFIPAPLISLLPYTLLSILFKCDK